MKNLTPYIVCEAIMYWNWFKSGIALATCFLLAIVLIKPIGVSTQFVIADGIIASAFNNVLITEDPTTKSGYTSSNAYLNKSGGKYAKAVAKPLSYGLVFVAAMVVGGFIASRRQSERAPSIPTCHLSRFGSSSSSSTVGWTLSLVAQTYPAGLFSMK